MLHLGGFVELRERFDHLFVLIEDGVVGEQVVTTRVAVHDVLRQVRTVVLVQVQLVEHALLHRRHVFFFEHRHIENRYILELRLGKIRKYEKNGSAPLVPYW